MPSIDKAQYVLWVHGQLLSWLNLKKNLFFIFFTIFAKDSWIKAANSSVKKPELGEKYAAFYKHEHRVLERTAVVFK